MADKSKELECINKVIKCEYHRGQFATDIHRILTERKDLIDCKGERPDIVINSEDEVIGIEHCQVDMLFRIKKKKAQSLVGQQHNKAVKLAEKYSDKELLESDIQNGEAVKPVLSSVEDYFELRNNFKYQVFIDNFNKVCDDHNKKCNMYRENLIQTYNNKDYSLYCLVEIPYIKENYFYIPGLKGSRKQVINGIPITFGMLDIIQQMRGFDVVIIFMYSFLNPNLLKDYLCYYFVPGYVSEGIKQQGVRPVLSFEIEKYPDLQIPLENISIENDQISFISTFTFDSKK